jgi:predicted nucleic acid-binding protein
LRRVALDSNVLAYLAGVDRHADDAAKIAKSIAMIAGLKDKSLLVASTQALGELFTVVVRSGVSREDARSIVTHFQAGFEIVECGIRVIALALDLAVAHKLQFWDALIVSAAAGVGCDLLLSEDMQDGFSWRGVTIVNPFAEPVNSKLDGILAA